MCAGAQSTSVTLGEPGLNPEREPRLQVEAGRTFLETLGRNGVNIALAKQDVCGALQLHLGTILRVVQDPVSDLHRADVRTEAR